MLLNPLSSPKQGGQERSFLLHYYFFAIEDIQSLLRVENTATIEVVVHVVLLASYILYLLDTRRDSLRTDGQVCRQAAAGAVVGAILEEWAECLAAASRFQLKLITCGIDAVDVLCADRFGLTYEAVVAACDDSLRTAWYLHVHADKLDGLSVEVVCCSPVITWQGNDIRSVSLHGRGEVEVDSTNIVADELLQPELFTRIAAALEPVDGCAIGSDRSDIERQDDGVPSFGTVSPSVIIIRKLDIRCGEVDGRIEIRPVSQRDVVGKYR